MDRTQFESRAASSSSRRASGRTCAAQFAGVVKGGAATLCPGSLPTYLPGGELMQAQGANSGINLRNRDRRVNLS